MLLLVDFLLLSFLIIFKKETGRLADSRECQLRNEEVALC